MPPIRKKVFTNEDDPRRSAYDNFWAVKKKEATANPDPLLPGPYQPMRRIKETAKRIPVSMPTVDVKAKPAPSLKTDISYPAEKKPSFSSQVSKLLPYASNLINSMRRVPLPDAPQLTDPVVAPVVRGDAQMAEIDRTIRSANAAADRNLDENTAAAVKATQMASGLNEKNKVSQWVDNTNASIRQQTNATNAGIQSGNNALMYDWKNNLVGAQIAQQRNSSENIANAADKYIEEQNQAAARQLDLDKLGVLKEMYGNSGVYDRLVDTLKTQGVIRNGYGGRLRPYASGGSLTTGTANTAGLNELGFRVARKSGDDVTWKYWANKPGVKGGMDGLSPEGVYVPVGANRRGYYGIRSVGGRYSVGVFDEQSNEMIKDLGMNGLSQMEALAELNKTLTPRTPAMNMITKRGYGGLMRKKVY